MINRTTKTLLAIGVVAASVFATTALAQAEDVEPQTAQKVCLESLAVVTAQESGGDEPYIEVDRKVIWNGPNNLRAGTTVPINKSVAIPHHIDVFEADGSAGNDFIDTTPARPLTDTWNAKGNGAYYKIKIRNGAC